MVKRPRDCTMCRECVRLEGWADRVQLNRVADHFIFTVESTGVMPPEQIVRESFGVLKKKAVDFYGLASAGDLVDGGDLEMDVGGGL